MNSAHATSVIGHMRRWGWVICTLLLLLSQLMLQLHSIDHLSSTDDETCQVCLAGGSLEHSLVGSLDLSPADSGDKTEPTLLVVELLFTHRPSIQSRAPPRFTTDV